MGKTQFTLSNAVTLPKICTSIKNMRKKTQCLHLLMFECMKMRSQNNPIRNHDETMGWKIICSLNFQTHILVGWSSIIYETRPFVFQSHQFWTVVLPKMTSRLWVHWYHLVFDRLGLFFWPETRGVFFLQYASFPLDIRKPMVTWWLNDGMAKWGFLKS